METDCWVHPRPKVDTREGLLGILGGRILTLGFPLAHPWHETHLGLLG